MFYTLSEFPLALGAHETDTTRPDDAAAAALDMLDSVARAVSRRADRGEFGAAGHLAVIRDAESNVGRVLQAMRPDAARPDMLDDSTIPADAESAVNDACDALGELAPAGVFVGPLPDDPAAFGVWVDVDDVAQWVDGCGEDLPDDPEFAGEAFLQINERGNATLWQGAPLKAQTGPDVTGPIDWVEVWGVV